MVAKDLNQIATGVANFWLDFFKGNGTFVVEKERVFIFVCWFSVAYTVRSYLIKKDDDPKKLLKRVPRWPVLGNIELLKGSILFSSTSILLFQFFSFCSHSTCQPDIKRFGDVLKSIIDKHGKYVELSLMGQRILVITDPVIIKECLMKRPNGFRRAKSFESSTAEFDSVSNSLFFSEGEMWRRHRRLAAPSFNHRNVGRMGDAVNEKLNDLITRIQVVSST